MEEITVRSVLRKINSLEDQVNSLKKENELLKEALGGKSLNECVQICEDISQNLQEKQEQVKSSITEHMNGIKYSLNERLDSYNKLQIDRDIAMNGSIQALQKRLDRTSIDIIDNDDNIAITYTDSNGKSEYGSFTKTRADEKTLTQDYRGTISLKKKFDSKSFEDENDIIYHIQLKTSSNKYISADYIENDLRNATYNIGTLTQKMERLQKQLSTSNGYIASNNFKTDKPSQEKLTNFVLECLSGSFNGITKEQIPVGTKIKNTFDNHIWVFNRIFADGLTSYKWEDFGSDNICVASNDGVHGLVTGSDEKFEGHIDLKGIITINGLKEEIENLIQSQLQLKSQLQSYEEKCTALESRIRILEDE